MLREWVTKTGGFATDSRETSTLGDRTVVRTPDRSQVWATVRFFGADQGHRNWLE